MKIKPQPLSPFQFIPETVEQLWNYSLMLHGGNENKARELTLAYASFGHQFGFDLGRVMMNTYCLKGKPTLTADGMAAVCRQSGLGRYIKIIKWNNQGCTIEMARTDEPEGVAHRYTYTMEMAAQQGLTRNRNWQTMPMQMLRVRALTMGLRATFPEACSGMYSADEIADNTHGLSDDERYEISAQSMGEEINTRPPRRHSQPPQRHHVERIAPPQQHQAVEVSDVSELVEELPEAEHVRTPTPRENHFGGMSDLKAAADHNYIEMSEVMAVNARLNANIETASAEERQRFFYTWCLSAYLRRSKLPLNWWRNLSESKHAIKALRAEFPALANIEDRDIGFMMGHRGFWELAKVHAHASVPELDQCHTLLIKIIQETRAAS